MNGMNNELEECERMLSCPVSRLTNYPGIYVEKLRKAAEVPDKYLGRVPFLLSTSRHDLGVCA
jgi:hypothetical protein